MTRDHFRDFELELEFMIDEHGKYNSGVFLRNASDAARWTGYQVNIGSSAAGEYCGGIYTDRFLTKGDERDQVRKKGDWNSMRILADGAHIVVDLNGVRVTDFIDPAPPTSFLAAGKIGLQSTGEEAGHAGWVKFRNVRVRPLH